MKNKAKSGILLGCSESGVFQIVGEENIGNSFKNYSNVIRIGGTKKERRKRCLEAFLKHLKLVSNYQVS